MNKHPQILEDYKQINVEYNIGNIHLSNIDETKIDAKYLYHKQAFEYIDYNKDPPFDNQY